MTAEPGRRLLEARWNGPDVISYAQNAEDVRLWRVFASHAAGFYVDIGAGHPVDASVTKLFYDRGWSGLNVEPGPWYGPLAAARVRDTTVEMAISRQSGEAELWVTFPYPELSSLVRPSRDLVPGAVHVTTKTVRTVRLDELLEEHALDRSIDFLKVDVEGAERDVLESFDPRVVRPRIVVVEAISPVTNTPTHQEWEHVLIGADYRFAAFDGINRFYVAEEYAELIPALAYPISPLDRYTRSEGVASAHSSDLDLSLTRSDATTGELRRAQESARHATEALAAVQGTFSWRVTRPLRGLRRLQRTASQAMTARPGLSQAEELSMESACAARLEQACRLLSEGSPAPREHENTPSLRSALAGVRDVLSMSRIEAPAAVWLLLTAVDGSYPDEREIEHAAQMLRTSGPEVFMRLVERRFAASLESGTVSTAGLDVVTAQVVVDVSQIATSGLHTGIQRVARECVSHWLRVGLPLRLSWFDQDAGALRLLDGAEAERLRRWQDHLAHDGIGTRSLKTSDDILVPWSCDLVLAELPTPQHSAALRGIVGARVHRSLCLVSYDLIPLVAPETVDRRIVVTFVEYLALLKHADRVSAISRQSADDLGAFISMLDGQGLRGPQIAEHALPTEAPNLEPLGAGSERADPLVLVVGVQTPRKNHAAVLEAGERLWRRGYRFELVFMGGSTWRAEGHFDAYVARLHADGMPVRVERRVSEENLWAAYRRARFTVFPSLIEGFGLPVAESLAAGTPVITSNYGSMAEIAAGGGAITVDPRNVDDLEEQMRRLLQDDELLERLEAEARRREFGSWSAYADAVWQFFFDRGPSET